MAEDWIKMRCDLYRDPKVILMADFLMDPEGQLAAFVNQQTQRDINVTRNVTRNVTVGGLLSVWSVARKQGKRHEDDLLLPGCSVSVLDDIADLPGFGAAMEGVGWVSETPQGLVFPRFFEENNADPIASMKAKAAERQRRYRQKNSRLNSNVTVTSRNAVEKRREEKSSTTPLPPSAGNPEETVTRPLCTLDQAKAYAPNVRMTESEAEFWWHTRNASGWTKSSASGGHPRKITSWQSDMATSAAWAKQQHAAAPADKKPIQFID